MCQTYKTHRSQLSLRWRWRHFELLLRFGGRRIIFRQVVQRWEWILSIYPRRTRSKSHSFQLTRCESWRKFLWTFDRPRNRKVILFYKNNFWFLKVIALHVKISWNHQLTYTRTPSRLHGKFVKTTFQDLPLLLHFHGKFIKSFVFTEKSVKTKHTFLFLILHFHGKIGQINKQKIHLYSVIFFVFLTLISQIPIHENSIELIFCFCVHIPFFVYVPLSSCIFQQVKKGLEGLRKVFFLTIRVHNSMYCTHLYLHQNSKQKVAHFLFVKTKLPKYIFFCLTGETIYQKYSYVT